MTKINDRMLAALEAVKVEKTKFDRVKTELFAQYEADVVSAQAGLENAIRWAHREGTPIRQIGIQGLNTKDAATVKAFLSDDESPVFVPDELRSVLSESGVTELDGNIYIVTEPDGTEWEFWALDLDGKLLFERSDYTDRGVDSDVPTPPSVVRTLQKSYPKADFTGLMYEED